MSTTESDITLPDGLRAYTKTWSPPPDTPIHAHCILLHGFSDHSHCYYTLPAHLASHGILVFIYDQRGWGRTSPPSSPTFAQMGTTRRIFSDLACIITARKTAFPKLPLFLLGHSMGGGLALSYTLTQKPELAGVVVWAPMLRLAPESQPFWGIETAGKIAAKVLPRKTVVQRLPAEWVSRDAGVAAEFAADAMCHDTASLEGLSGMFERGEVVMGKAREGAVLGTSVVVHHGTGDRITDWRASVEVMGEGTLGVKEGRTKTLRLWEGAYHKLHAEPDGVGEKFADEVARWCLERVQGGWESKL